MRAALGALAALAVGLAVAAGGCGGGSVAKTQAAASTEGHTAAAGSTTVEPAAAKGGVYRVGVEKSFAFTNEFDPTGEYIVYALSFYSNLLLRTLLNYKHVAGPPGNELVPDLATSLPQVSSDGLTWTFHLKDGIKFGPPVSREITSKDILYSFERIGTKSLIAQYGFYYSVIEGMDDFSQGKAKTISGIETPDPKTIVFHLTEPTGDFGYRLSMPATAPIPPEVGKCYTKAGDYGRDVIASGPYMIEGSDQIDISSCDKIQPISGYQPEQKLILVRNPDYDPATDSPELREANPDRFEFTIDTNAKDIYDKIKLGELESGIVSASPEVYREYSTNPDLQPRIHSNPSDVTFYIYMNLTQPPFDDIHVRKAANLAIDKRALIQVSGGPITGDPATHIVPDAILDDKLKGYDPYPGPDIAAAKAEMKLSKYDTNKDGLCDAPACQNVLHLTGTLDTNRKQSPIIEQAFAQIGIQLTTRELDNPFPPAGTVAKNIPIGSFAGWGKDYADASTFMVLFSSQGIYPNGNNNYSLVGLTPKQASSLTGITGSVDNVPSVDSDIARCTPLVGDPRVQCWADLDKKLMEQVVPWIPYEFNKQVDVLGPAVTEYDFDQSTGQNSYAHAAVDPSKQRS